MRTAILGAALAVLAATASVQPALAAEPAAATTMTTVFVNKGSSSSVTKALNKLHAEMEAAGWAYGSMSVYTEDGDLQGIFVTYVRPAGASAQAAATPAP